MRWLMKRPRGLDGRDSSAKFIGCQSSKRLLEYGTYLINVHVYKYMLKCLHETRICLRLVALPSQTATNLCQYCQWVRGNFLLTTRIRLLSHPAPSTLDSRTSHPSRFYSRALPSRFLMVSVSQMFRAPVVPVFCRSASLCFCCTLSRFRLLPFCCRMDSVTCTRLSESCSWVSAQRVLLCWHGIPGELEFPSTFKHYVTKTRRTWAYYWM